MLVTPFSAFGLSARSVLMLDSHVYTVMLESFTINFITRQKNYFASLILCPTFWLAWAM